MPSTPPSKTNPRSTLVVDGPMAWRRARVAAARARSQGLQIMTVPQVVERLAGGFRRLVPRDDLLAAVRLALAEGGLQELGAVATLPGMGRAVAASIWKAWLAGHDLQEPSPSPRAQDMALLERRVLEFLPAAAAPPSVLCSEARGRLSVAAAVLGPVTFEGVHQVAPCWRALLVDLAGHVPLTWHASPSADLSWAEGTPIDLVPVLPAGARVHVFLCANPRHEVLEAFRWARALLADGRATPADIAITAPSPSDWDEAVIGMATASGLPLHFVHGRPALATRDGQRCAALAEVLLHGLSADRIRSVVTLCREPGTLLAGLGDQWLGRLPDDNPLSTLQQWRRLLESTPQDAWPDGITPAPVLLPVLEILERGPEAAEEAGEKLLTARSRFLWRRVLREGPAEALEVTLATLRMPEDQDAAAAIAWGPARSVASAPRRHAWLLGMTSRAWPRAAGEDPLLPDHLVPRHVLDPDPVSRQDRRHFHCILEATGAIVVLSRSRRDAQGKRLAPSPLIPAGPPQRALPRGRVPRHAASEPDRLLARPAEFAGSPQGLSARACWQDWSRPELTPHDGLVRPHHPVLERATRRVHSASSLQKLLRDPLGFAWHYALHFKEPALADEPLELDALAFGRLVHTLLEETVRRLEPVGGYATVERARLEHQVWEASRHVAGQWEESQPLPPRLVWEATLHKACLMVIKALMLDPTPLEGQRSWTEVGFGDPHAVPTADHPWDPTASVCLEELDLRIRGRIDRIDLSADGTRARVTDYKTGATPKKPWADPDLNDGQELQRCLYSLAVRKMLPGVREVEARLAYVADEPRLLALSDVDAVMRRLASLVGCARQSLQDGRAFPGPGTAQYNDLVFALPARPDVYFERKATALQESVPEALARLWEGTPS